MRTNIVLNDELVAEAIKLTNARSKRDVVDLALQRLVQHERQRRLLQLKGKQLIDPEYDVSEVRHNMTRNAG